MTHSVCGKSWLRAALRTSVATSALIAGLSMPALAQDEGTPDEPDTIVVTGSLIPRAELEATSPMTVISSEDLTLSNTVNSEEFLNKLPQTIPGFDSTSNNPGTAEANVNLRGLGSARTLVLVNGRRWPTSSQFIGVVDLNTIPATLIERIDVVTGGASATYGSDAIAGVVNFIMRDDFEGLQLDTGFQFTEEMDGEISETSVTVGTNFDNGRGNITLYGSFTNRESILQGEREETRVTLLDNGNEFGSVNIPSGFVLDFNPNYSLTGLDPTFPACSVEGSTNGGAFCTTDSIGWIFNPNGAGALPHIDSGPNTTRYNYAPLNYLQLPQERFSIAGFSHYDITEDVEAYFRGVWTQSNVKQLLAPTPVFTTLTINIDNPYVGLLADPQAFALIAGNTFANCGDNDGNAVLDCQIVVGRRMLELGGRLSDARNQAFQFAGGFKGNFWDDWGWDIYGAYAASDSTTIQTGNVHTPSYREQVAAGTCNIFSENAMFTTPGCIDAIKRTGAIVSRTQQAVFNGSFYGNSGDIKSPLADSSIGLAGGVEYRREQLDAIPDSVLGPDVAGFNQAPEVHGSFFVWEAFGEVSIPLVENKPFAEELVAEVKYRYSDYSNLTDTVDTYAYGGSWTPVSGLKFRGQFQRAVRAPNIGELFSPQTNGFPSVQDPCSTGLGKYGPATIDATCVATGMLAANVGSNFQINSQIEGLFGGNPLLGPESSDTWTVGVVIQPDAVPDLSLTVDYYNVTVSDAISAVPAQEIFDLCHIQGLPDFCNLIQRIPAGPVDIFFATQQNVASLSTSGIDLQLDYSIALADMGMPDWGRFGVYVLGTWIEKNEFTATPLSATIDCVGFFGGQCGEPDPQYRINTRFDWSMGPWLARVRWQWFSSVDDFSGSLVQTATLDSQSYVDLSIYYQATENVRLGFGVLNIFGTDFVRVGDQQAEQSNTYPATYEPLGRQFFVRTQLKF